MPTKGLTTEGVALKSDPRLLNNPFTPEIWVGLTCGARTRKGTPCKRKDLYRKERCRLHGGLSTGPRTEAGKARSALNGNIPKKL